VHGGGVTALLDAAAALRRGPGARRIIEARLTSSVPVDTTLDLDAEQSDGTERLTVRQGAETLASAAISPASPTDALEGSAPWRGGDAGWPLPVSDQCLACGALNPLGLQAGLRFDEEGVWARIEPRAPCERLHPGFAPVLLDEIAWWLAALVMKEGGVTNRIRLSVDGPDQAWGTPLIAAGRFDAVTPVDRKRTFWRTESALLTGDGIVLARGSIVFRGGPEYSARQLEYFRGRTAPDVFGRMFPNHVE
jgi:hypothetical protein